MRAFVAIISIVIFAGSARAAGPTSNPASSVEHESIRRSDANQKPASTQASAVRNIPGSAVDLQRVAISLLLVIGVIIAARFAMKKLFPAVAVGRNSQVIRVLSRSVVGPKQQFLLVQIGRRLVLVGDSGASMNALSQIEDPEEVASLIGKLQSESHNSATNVFASLFRKADKEFDTEFKTEIKNISEPALADGEEVDRSSNGAELEAASSEISGLMDRVRLLTKRVRQP